MHKDTMTILMWVLTTISGALGVYIVIAINLAISRLTTISNTLTDMKLSILGTQKDVEAHEKEIILLKSELNEIKKQIIELQRIFYEKAKVA